MNICKIDNIRYKYESFWRSNKNKIKKDSNGELLPFPQEGKYWYNKTFFLNKLLAVENFLKSADKYHQYNKEDYKDCLLCKQKNVNTGIYTLNRLRWENGLSHYVDVHNIKPSLEFCEKIFSHKNKNTTSVKEVARVTSKIVKGKSVSYLKISRNQMMIIDALMIHGGFNKKYENKGDEGDYKFSEHSGLLDFNSNGLDKIIVYGNTTRIAEGDDELYMPENNIESYDYEYIFHTHPPTPKPGGRAEWGVLYEFPSISDLYHFIKHHNKGVLQGSIVMASEGLYNIRVKNMSVEKIKIDEDAFFDSVNRSFNSIQNSAIDKYGINFSSYEFRSKISHDTTYIKKFNHTLNKYNIHIDFYPRIKDKKGKWVVDSIYLPVRPTEIQTVITHKII